MLPRLPSGDRVELAFGDPDGAQGAGLAEPGDEIGDDVGSRLPCPAEGLAHHRLLLRIHRRIPAQHARQHDAAGCGRGARRRPRRVGGRCRGWRRIRPGRGRSRRATRRAGSRAAPLGCPAGPSSGGSASGENLQGMDGRGVGQRAGPNANTGSPRRGRPRARRLRATAIRACGPSLPGRESRLPERCRARCRRP